MNGPTFLNGIAPINLKPIMVKPIDKYYVGLDIGQSVDATAICICHHTVRPLYDEPWIDNLEKATTKQPSEERFHIVHLERLPLGTSYPDQIVYVRNLMRREPLRSKKAPLIMDDTGVGRPAGDLWEAAGLRPLERVTIVAGREVSRHGSNRWHVPKSVLISTLESRMHSGELKIAAGLAEAEVLRSELKDFERKITGSGNLTWSAREGAHDDVVLATALSIYWAVYHGHPSAGNLPWPF
jgi:hypothetical protein